jgi:hypothetical protein
MPQAADGTMVMISFDDHFPECPLVNPLDYLCGDVSSFNMGFNFRSFSRCLCRIIKPHIQPGSFNRKGEISGIVSDNENWPMNKIGAWYNTVKIDQRDVITQCIP